MALQPLSPEGCGQTFHVLLCCFVLEEMEDASRIGSGISRTKREEHRLCLARLSSHPMRPGKGFPAKTSSLIRESESHPLAPVANERTNNQITKLEQNPGTPTCSKEILPLCHLPESKAFHQLLVQRLHSLFI